MSGVEFKIGDDFDDNKQEEEEPSLEEMSVDDSLPMLVRLKKYVNSDLFLHRLFVVKELTETVHDVGFEESASEVVPILNDLYDDPEALIRQTLVDQIPRISNYFLENGGEEGYILIRDSLLPLVTQLITDDIEQVRQAAQQALVQLLAHLNKEDLETKFCPILERLVSEDLDEEYRVEALNIMTESASIFGSDICIRVLLPLVEKLVQDPQFRIRKLCAVCCGPLCAAIAPDPAVEKVLKIYEELCPDEIWGVRKGCVESLVQIAESVPMDIRAGRLTDIFCKLANDPSRWVRCEAFRHLGRFIFTFATEPLTEMKSETDLESEVESVRSGELRRESDAKSNNISTSPLNAVPSNSSDYRSIENEDSDAFLSGNDDDDELGDITDALRRISFTSSAQIGMDEDDSDVRRRSKAHIKSPSVLPPRLLELYKIMAQPDSARNIDVETVYHCAFHFPGVLLTLGRSYWPELSEVYHSLVNDLQWKVRRTLAYSIHEVARIIGTKLTEAELVPVFNSLARDLDEVKIGIMQNFTSFLRVCTPETRMCYLTEIDKIMAVENNNNWRLRSIFALQVCELCDLFPSQVCAEYLVEPAFMLAKDDVACVREYSQFAMAKLVLSFHNAGDQMLTQELSEHIREEFAQSDLWVHRQTYIRLCKHLVRSIPSATFVDLYIPSLLALAEDKVPNIRITLALVLADTVSLDEYKERHDLRTCIQRLEADVDKDVVQSCAIPVVAQQIDLPPLWA